MTRRITRVERLARKEEKATVKRIISLSIVSGILAIFLFTIGIQLLGKFADFLDAIFKNKEINVIDNSAIGEPKIDPLPHATNSARLAVSGFASDSNSVIIYLNGQKSGTANVEAGKFKFEDLELRSGENKVEAKAVSGGRESNFSDAWIVILDREKPTLEVEGPAEGQFFSGNNRIKVFGKAEKDTQVYANGFLASIDLEGKFEVFVPLGEGKNTVEIKAIDLAGNTKTEMRKITFRK
ncbi:hypothetical protein HYU92_04315 [Candidatus Curtissbacteria bacterium]|nr:hypothetical protein [Candidatus Curtissbacteria bacterium]